MANTAIGVPNTIEAGINSYMLQMTQNQDLSVVSRQLFQGVG
jgi:hypothetical protein